MRRFSKDEYLVFYQGIRKELHAKYQNYDLIISRDYSLSDGIRALAPKLKDNYLDNYQAFPDISGSESLIYLYPGDKYEVYKLNNPFLKMDNSKLNEYLFNLILQDWLFPEYSYSIIGRLDNELLLSQLIATGEVPSDNQIKSLLTSYGWTWNNGKYYLSYLNGIIVISDANPRNCYIQGNELQGFDFKFELIHE